MPGRSSLPSGASPSAPRPAAAAPPRILYPPPLLPSSAVSSNPRSSSTCRRSCRPSPGCRRFLFQIPGASLRDRATLPSPLRGLGPSGGYPSRLRPLRGLRAPLGPAVRFAHRRLPLATANAPGTGVRVLPPSAIAARLRLACPRRLRRPWAAHRLAGVRSRERRLAPAAPRPRPLNRPGGSPPVPIPEPFPRRSVPWVGSSLRPSAARLSHPTQQAAGASPTPCR